MHFSVNKHDISVQIPELWFWRYACPNYLQQELLRFILFDGWLVGWFIRSFVRATASLAAKRATDGREVDILS